jgi:hypothetical protein
MRFARQPDGGCNPAELSLKSRTEFNTISGQARQCKTERAIPSVFAASVLEEPPCEFYNAAAFELGDRSEDVRLELAGGRGRVALARSHGGRSLGCSRGSGSN